MPALFKGTGLTISLDTNDDPSGRWGGVFDQLLEYVDILLPNETEACRMAQKATVDGALWRELGGGCRARGCQEMRIARLRCSGRRKDPAVGYDCRAGDSFNAGFLLGWLKGWPPDQCCTR